MKVNPHHVMALRRLTYMPVLACRDALVEARGDLLAVIRRMRRPPCYFIWATDEEITRVLSDCGVVYIPEVKEHGLRG
jgi:translation elongation factor EF-Ts